MQLKEELGADVYYQFDSYALCPDTRTLRHGDSLVELTPKVFTTLLVLVENRDKVLTKDELLTAIWPDQFVDLSNLSQNISVLRKSLGETESGKKYIATFQGRGYRFVGPVEVRRHSETDRAIPPHGSTLSSVDLIPASPIETAPHAGSDRPNSVLRYWNSKNIIAWCALILMGSVAIIIREDVRHSKPESSAGENTPVKTYARMTAALGQPSWSRDGSALAFIATDLSGTQSTIYVQRKGDIQPHRVVSDSGRYSSPSWSPDGAQLACLRFGPDTAEVVILDIQRKTSRVLTRLFPHRYGLNYRHLDWSPDGKFLVIDDKSQASEPFSLFLIYIKSGQRVRLTYPDSDMIGDVSPRVSPDGTSVAFIRDIYLFEQDIYVTNVQGRTYRRITSLRSMISDVSWKTEKELAFAADNGDGFRFWQVDLNDPGRMKTIPSRVVSNRPLQLSVSPNGRDVAFSNYAPNLDIWSIDTSDHSDRWVPVIQAPGENIRPAVSPDGKLLAFLSNVSGEFQIWVSQTDGTNAWPVPTGALVPASFCWSSDGRSLIFSPQRVHGLYEVSIHGDASVRQISSIYTDPYDSIDGRSLFARAHLFIYRIPLGGGDAKEVTEQGGAPIAESRDGRYIYFSQGRMSTSIGRLDLQNGHQDEITDSMLPGYADAWALSQGGIFFLGEEHGHPTVSFLNFATGREEHIADFAGDLPQIEMSGWGISPDAKRLWVVRAVPMPSDIKTTMLPPD